MNNFKITSKMKLLAIISSIIIVVGLALGTVLHFTGSGFFAFGGEYTEYKSVTVSYMLTEFKNDSDVGEICNTAFNNAGIKSVSTTGGATSIGRDITYLFNANTDDAKLQSAVDAINAQITALTADFNDIPQSRAFWHTQNAVYGGEFVLTRAAIALAVMVALHCLYTLIRYGLTAMITACAVDLHNLALFAALLAICRAPITSAILVVALLVVLTTAFGVTLTLDRIKRNLKNSDFAKNSVEEITDLSAGQTAKVNVALPVFLAIAAVLCFLLMAISSSSVMLALVPALSALVAFAVCAYGNTLFAPAIYPSIRKMCGKKSAEPSQKKGK